MHMQSPCFACQTHLFFEVLVSVAVVVVLSTTESYPISIMV